MINHNILSIIVNKLALIQWHKNVTIINQQFYQFYRAIPTIFNGFKLICTDFAHCKLCEKEICQYHLNCRNKFTTNCYIYTFNKSICYYCQCDYDLIFPLSKNY